MGEQTKEEEQRRREKQIQMGSYTERERDRQIDRQTEGVNSQTDRQRE